MPGCENKLLSPRLLWLILCEAMARGREGMIVAPIVI